jgi:hypothetical protein
MGDLISRQAAIDAANKLVDRFERILRDIRETNEDESVCGLCEYDGAFIGQSGDWCNECPGFDKADCFKLSDKRRKKWLKELGLPSAQPERKKGKWIYNSPVTMKCDQCGLVIKDWDWHRVKYCPNCMAEMRGEQE